MRRYLIIVIFCSVGIVLAGCGGSATQMPANALPAASAPVVDATNPAVVSSQPSQAPALPANTAGVSLPTYPDPDQSIPAGIVPANKPGSYAIFTWNNLGMHCYMNDYSRFLILPPYNVYWAQVVARGSEDPAIVTSLQLNYAVPSVTKPEAHSNFWQYAAGYGFNLQPGFGLTGKQTSGTMDNKQDHYIAEGVPAIDISDSGAWDPYPFYTVQAVDNGGKTVAEIFNVSPVSSEMRCNLCHAGDTIEAVEDSILKTHDTYNKTTLFDQAASGKLVFCASCHADPAMGVMESKGSTFTLSGAMHTFHADKATSRTNLPEVYCQSCHPGEKTQCLRDAMFKAGITCTNCHGTMAEVGDAARTPWVNEPSCTSCHGKNLGRGTATNIDSPNTLLTTSDTELYRNSKAHGGSGIYCAACHGSPHAIYPTVTDRDNQYSIYLQGKPGTIKECSVCHGGRPDEAFWHFGGGG
jgi:hypothetical protein